MLVLRTTPIGRRYYEIDRSVSGTLPSTKNHQGCLKDKKEESHAKIFECPGSPRCPVETVKNYLFQLNSEANFFFHKPRAIAAAKFNPQVHKIWFCNASLAKRTLTEMIRWKRWHQAKLAFLRTWLTTASEPWPLTCLEKKILKPEGKWWKHRFI